MKTGNAQVYICLSFNPRRIVFVARKELRLKVAQVKANGALCVCVGYLD